MKYPKSTTFKSLDWQGFRGPIVYVAWHNENCHYVGVTSNGLRRPMDPRHHAYNIIENATHVEVYRFSSISLAKDAEKELIQKLSPIHNVIGMGVKAKTPEGIDGNDIVLLKVWVAASLKDRLKHRAVEENRTLTGCLVRALEAYLTTPLV